MRIIDVEQGSQAWLDARVGVLTASVMDQVITPKTMKTSASMGKLVNRMLAEVTLGRSLDDASSLFIERGTQLEDEARRWYEFKRDVEVERVGLCLRDDGLLGFSPDGLVGEDGGVEIKCPTAAVHMGYLLDGLDQYYHQIMASLWISQRQWWDFVSYCPGLPPVLVRFHPDLKFFKAMEEATAQFLSLYKEKRKQLDLLLPTATPVAAQDDGDDFSNWEF